jgi:GxxExxY protein
MPLIHAELSEKILGCCIRVHKALGPGFLEKIYEEALCLEVEKAGLKYERQKPVSIHYGGEVVGEHRLDLLVENLVVSELKASAGIEDVHLATALQLALVVSFARPTLDIKRVVLTQ